MEHLVAREVANSRASTRAETIRARQAHYIRWTQIKHIEDPVGPQTGFKIIVALYIKYVMLGVNCLNKCTLRSETCKNYAKDIGILFELRNFTNPVDFTDEDNWTSIIVHNLEREENIAKRRKPLNSRIFAVIMERAAKADKDGLDALMANVCAVGRTLGFRRSEICQTRADKVDYHVYPSGKTVMKALNGKSTRFWDVNEKEMVIKSNTNLDRIDSGKTRFDHQKIAKMLNK